MTTFHVITLFPQALDSYLKESIVARAIKLKKIKIRTYDLFRFLGRQSERPDDRPYGGGPGMVLKAEPILKAVRHAQRQTNGSAKIIIFSPHGTPFTNARARLLARLAHHVILIAGRYEGVDARVKKILRAEEVSIGPYILTGGELPALVVIDAVARQIPGVLGRSESLEESRHAAKAVYTRPDVITVAGRKYCVPAVLKSGHQQKIAAWRQGH